MMPLLSITMANWSVPRRFFPAAVRSILPTFWLPRTARSVCPFSAPAPVQQLMVFLPDDGTTVTTEGLISAGPWTVEQKQMRYYKAMNAPAGQLANIVIQGIAPMAEAPSLTPASRVPQIIAAVGGGLVLVIGAVIVLTRSGKPAKAKG